MDRSLAPTCRAHIPEIQPHVVGRGNHHMNELPQQRHISPFLSLRPPSPSDPHLHHRHRRLAAADDGPPPRTNPDPDPPRPLPLFRRVRLAPRPRHQGRGHRDRPHRGRPRGFLLPHRHPVGRGGRDPAPGGGHPRRHGAACHPRLAPLRAGRVLLGAPDAAPARGRRDLQPYRGCRRRGGGRRGHGRRGRGHGDRRAHDGGGGAFILHRAGVALGVLLRRWEISTFNEQIGKRGSSN